MTDRFAAARKLCAFGFYLFPVARNSKVPAIKGFNFNEQATRDPAKIKAWWGEPECELNIGISTSLYGEGEQLLVVDVDVAKGGYDTIESLRVQGKILPPTFTQITASGGRHFVYKTATPVKQGVGVLGAGVDTRAKGGYIVGAGSEIEGKAYTLNIRPIESAPEWLIEHCGNAPTKAEKSAAVEGVDTSLAERRALKYLEGVAGAVEGAGGDAHTYKVACAIKDFGVTEEQAVELMLTHFNTKCSPAWEPDAIIKKVQNAYSYGNDRPGVNAPEADFKPIPPPLEPVRDESYDAEITPIQNLNRNFAFVMTGGSHSILYETTDVKGKKTVEFLKEETFHAMHAALKMQVGGRQKEASRLWMEASNRRSYRGVCFRPELATPPEWYNLWQGFSVEPQGLETASPRAVETLMDFLEHIEQNVCAGDKKLTHWLLSFFAHLFQKPGEKPLVALVFKGRKGAGKSFVVDRIGELVNAHFKVVSGERYLKSHFNAHLESCLLLSMEEVFWGGDKEAEGILKDMITGSRMQVERKGKESRTMDNLLRIAIIGNESWMVPASVEERRFAIFNVTDGRLQDIDFFKRLKEGFRDHGADRLLLHYFQTYDIGKLDINRAPQTAGLLEQKQQSLSAVYRWWFDSLQSGYVLGFENTGEWNPVLPKTRAREAFRSYCEERRLKAGNTADDQQFTKALQKCCFFQLSRRRIDDVRQYTFELHDLETCRKEFANWIGHDVVWDPLD